MEESDFDTIQFKTAQPRLEYCNFLPSCADQNLFAFCDSDLANVPFPPAPGLIKVGQAQCKLLKKLIAADKRNQFSVKPVEGFDLAHYKNKIYIPESLTTQLVEWYHKLLVHPWTSHLEATLRQHYWWQHLWKEAEACCKLCHTCQMAKKQRKKYGKMTAKKAEEKIWNWVNVDVWAPIYHQQQKWQNIYTSNNHDWPSQLLVRSCCCYTRWPKQFGMPKDSI